MHFRAEIKSIYGPSVFTSPCEFKTYDEAFKYMKEHLPDGFEGYVIQEPEIEIDLEEICTAQEQYDNQSH